MVSGLPSGWKQVLASAPRWRRTAAGPSKVRLSRSIGRYRAPRAHMLQSGSGEATKRADTTARVRRPHAADTKAARRDLRGRAEGRPTPAATMQAGAGGGGTGGGGTQYSLDGAILTATLATHSRQGLNVTAKQMQCVLLNRQHRHETCRDNNDGCSDAVSEVWHVRRVGRCIPGCDKGEEGFET